MRTQNESDREKGTDNEEPRKAAGFEVLAAERDEVIILFPTKFFMLGISVLIMIISIICWIGTYWAWEFFVWSVFSMLSIGLIIFLPEYFSNIINVVIHLCYWIAFSIFVLVRLITIIIKKGEVQDALKKMPPAQREAEQAIADRVFPYWIGCTCAILPLAILVTFLMFRFFFFFYKNR
ncbi:hypothetical protein CRE_01226 [Caenorhabditis remanei]|uniref:Transmembrane protein n=1 Tax=Caenorhabditis remanei TaxID=31234 RepID=E3N4P4_CAERE|nr:hypothetical protein CRE_01226 [Caenorhabditis remanei]